MHSQDPGCPSLPFSNFSFPQKDNLLANPTPRDSGISPAVAGTSAFFAQRLDFYMASIVGAIVQQKGAKMSQGALVDAKRTAKLALATIDDPAL